MKGKKDVALDRNRETRDLLGERYEVGANAEWQEEPLTS